MRMLPKLLLGAVLLGSIATLVTTDALVVERKLTANLLARFQGEEDIGEGEPKQPDYLNGLLGRFGFESTETEEFSILTRLLPEDLAHTRVLLRDNDRAGLMAWGSTDDAEGTYRALKDALLPSFSEALEGLSDEVHGPPDDPWFELLTFRDPALAEERLLFLHKDDALYEFHIAEGQDDAFRALITALTES